MVYGQSGFHGLSVLSAVAVVEFSIERENVQTRHQTMVGKIVMEMVQRFSHAVMLDVQVRYPSGIVLTRKQYHKWDSKTYTF